MTPSPLLICAAILVGLVLLVLLLSILPPK